MTVLTMKTMQGTKSSRMPTILNLLQRQDMIIPLWNRMNMKKPACRHLRHRGGSRTLLTIQTMVSAGSLPPFGGASIGALDENCRNGIGTLGAYLLADGIPFGLTPGKIFARGSTAANGTVVLSPSASDHDTSISSLFADETPPKI